MIRATQTEMNKNSSGFVASILLSIAALLLLSAGCEQSVFRSKNGLVTNNTDWPSFMSRQGPVWEKLPENFDEGAFLDNGLMGAMIYRQSENQIRWEMGRSDVPEHRRDNQRLPIGGLVLETAGIIQGGTLRLDLRNAEVRGQIMTDKGSISFRTLIHTDLMAMVLDLEPIGEEKHSYIQAVNHLPLSLSLFQQILPIQISGV